MARKLATLMLFVCAGFMLTGFNQAYGGSSNGEGTSCIAVPSWNSSTVYTDGDQVGYNGNLYTANWWTQGQNPESNSGQWEVWTLNGACTGGGSDGGGSSGGGDDGGGNGGTSCTAVPAWNASTVYTEADQVSYGGNLYTANWWTQGQNPESNSGQWEVWTLNGACSGGGSGGGDDGGGDGGGDTIPDFLFSPYKDIAIGMNWNTITLATKVTGTREPLLDVLPSGLNAVTLAFATGECGSENWAGVQPVNLVSNNLPQFDAAGVFYVISTGGVNGSFTCGSPSAFLNFIQTYYTPHMAGVDFDIEVGQSQAVINDLIAGVQAAQQEYPNMRFSFTLATLGSADRSAPDLGTTGQLVMDVIQARNLTDYYINLMAMDYGSTNPQLCVVVNGLCDMGKSAIAAAEDLHNRYGLPYSHIEVTVIIGRNDTVDEIFTLEDADELSDFALQVGLGGIHFWSFDRDTDCDNPLSVPTCNSWPHAGVLGFTNRFISDGL